MPGAAVGQPLTDRWDTAAWLASIASTGLDGAPHPRGDEALDDRAFDHLLGEVAVHGLEGLLVAAIAEGRVTVTEHQAEQSGKRHRGAVATTLALDWLLLQVLHALGDAGVQCCVFKGVAAAHLCYPDPSLRVYSDIDLLVAGDQFDRAAGVLEDVGLQRLWPELRPGFDRRFGKGTDFRSRDGLGVDLHRMFVHGYFGQRIVAADLFTNTTSFPLAGVSVPALGADNQLLSACYNAAASGGEPRLSTLRDVAQLCLGPSTDPAAVLDRARTWGGEAVLARAIIFTWDRLGLQAPSRLHSWASDYRPSAADRRRLDQYLRADWSWGRVALGGVGAISGVRSKSAYLAALLAPRRELLAHRQQGLAGRWRHGAALLSARRRKS